MNSIYTVSCLYDIPPFYLIDLSKEERIEKQKEYDCHGGDRCFGWFNTKKMALDSVLENCYDIHEHVYKYAVVEKYEEGIHSFADINESEWFEWNNEFGKYESIEKPEELKRASGFAGIG